MENRTEFTHVKKLAFDLPPEQQLSLALSLIRDLPEEDVDKVFFSETEMAEFESRRQDALSGKSPTYSLEDVMIEIDRTLS